LKLSDNQKTIHDNLSESITAIAYKVHISSKCADDITIKSLIEYIYLDRINIPHHKRRFLLGLANDLCMESLCNRICDIERMSEVRFTIDMNAAINDLTYADVVFTMDHSYDFKDAGAKFSPVLFGHKSILSRIPYFKAMFNSEFKESSNLCCLPSDNDELKSRFISSIDISGLISNGLDIENFKMLVQYAYIGQINSVNIHTLSPSCMITSISGNYKICRDLNETLEKDLIIPGENLMGILVAANMMSFTTLSKYCERQLSVHIADFPENTKNLLDFAQAYNFKRLEEQCVQLLQS
jgi:hypothetical protein